MNSRELEEIRKKFAEARQHLSYWTQIPPIERRKSEVLKAHCENAIASLLAIVDMLEPPSSLNFPFPKKFDNVLEAHFGAYMWAHVAEWRCEQEGIDMSSEVPKYDLVPRPDWLK